MSVTLTAPDLVLIPGGSFWMGENEEDKFAGDTERPRHRVTLAPFLMERAPVTLDEFRAFRPAHEPGLPDAWPAASVSWEEAVAYCEWLSQELDAAYRLPSEAEWEYAARSGTQTPYPWGDAESSALANHFYDEQGNKVGPGHRTPPGAYPPNDFALFDMLGNVCEWVQDSWLPNYCGAPEDGSAWTNTGNKKSALRVLRGGAWDYLPRLLRCSWRDALPASSCRDNVGFRIASDC